MDEIKAGGKKRRGRRRRRPPPPPIFTGDTVAFSNFDAMSNMPLFPGNCVAPPFLLKPDEMLDKFNELLDWRLPGEPKNFKMMLGDVRANQDTDLNCSVPREKGFDNQNRSYTGKRKKIQSFDLRNRIGQHKKRRNSSPDHNDRPSEGWDNSFDRSRIGNRPGGNVSNHKSARTGYHWVRSFENHQERVDDRERIVEKSDMRDRLNKNFDQNSFRITDKVRLNSNLERSDYKDCNERGVANHIFNARDPRTDDFLQEFDRQVREYWPDRELSDMDQPPHPSQGLRFDYPNERLSGNRNEVHEERRDSWQGDYVQSDIYCRQPDRDAGNSFESQRDLEQHSEPCWSKDSRQPAFYRGDNYPGEEQTLAGSSYNCFRSPARDDRNDQITFRETQLMKPADDDLAVVIHKPKFVKFTFTETDSIRGMLIDLVVNCGNPAQMPEFLSSGLRRAGREFYVKCRTRETLDWLLQQTLPPLNSLQLFMRRNKIYQIVKVAAFAQGCRRTREEILKLLKLQNGKKGFNFDNWHMRGYQCNSKGTYFAFDVPLEEADLLKDLGCQLSFELKSLTFKIATNSIRTVNKLPW